MEKQGAKKKKKSITSEQLKAAYMEHVLMHGQQPKSVYAFMKELESIEADFYEHYNSFNGIQRAIWSDWLDETLAIVEKDEAYANYTVREKLLGFYFTWIEKLKENRSFALKKFNGLSPKDWSPAFLDSLKIHFKEYVRDLIIEGKDTSEIAERSFDSQYSQAFWMHFLFITRFWINDESSNFEKTDAAIEKTVNLAFDLVGRGPLDSMIDFARFMFQNRN